VNLVHPLLAIFGFSPLLVAIAVQAAPIANWRIVKTHDGAFGYDASSIDTDAPTGYKIVTTGMYMPNGQQWEKLRYHFLLQDQAFDCAKKRYTPAIYYLFDENAQPMDVKESGENWQPVDDNGFNRIIYEVTCEGRAIPEAVPGGDSDTAMQRMKAFFQ
jgi:hypothetical protein